MEISIIIPCLNEAKTIGRCVHKALSSISRLNLKGEVVVADNGSTDNSAALARQAGARVVAAPKIGYGAALMAGFAAAEGALLLMADADDSYNLEEIEPFISKLNEGYDFVIGNRFMGKIEKGAMPFLHRYFGTPLLTWVMNLFFKTGMGDTNCGMRALTKQAFNKLELRAEGMEFATEMIIKSSLAKLKMAEVPCNLYKDKRTRRPHLKTWRDGWRHLRFMLLFTPKWTFLLPGSLLAFLGLFGMLALLLRDIISPASWPFVSQKHILSSMLLFLFGFQIIGLGLAAHYFSHRRSLLRKYFNLERGVICGGLLSLLGILILLYLFLSYYFGLFAYLTDAIRFDLAVFGMALFMLGAGFVFTSFLLSLFYLKI